MFIYYVVFTFSDKSCKKMKSLDKVYRLHSILKYARSYLPANELIEKLDCSDSTLEKTIRELREMYGAPIIYDRRYKGYKYIGEEKFELPGIWFSGDELAALFAIHQLLSEIPDGLLTEKLSKIKERIEKTAEKASLSPDKWAECIRILPMTFRKPNDVAFRVAVEGIIRRKRIEITYEGTLKPVSSRKISPIRLVRYRDNWYLDAYCHACNGLRQFELSRTISAKITNESSFRVPKKETEEFFADSYGIFSGKADKKAVIRFKGIAAKIVSKEIWHRNQKGTYDPTSETYTLSIPYKDDRELIMDILRWGDLAEVIDPPELRQNIINILKSTLRNY